MSTLWGFTNGVLLGKGVHGLGVRKVGTVHDLGTYPKMGCPEFGDVCLTLPKPVSIFLGTVYIVENPILGVGLLEGRKDIKQHLLMNEEMSKKLKEGYLGSYSHMAFLDWMIEFGCLFGGFVIVGMLILLWRAFFVLHGVRRFCSIMFAFSGFLPLMFSGVWYQSELFLIFLGCSVSNYNNLAH